MKAWKEIFGTEETKPDELDLISSPTTIYQRRNIRQVQKTENNGIIVSGWQRDERELTITEYEQMRLMEEIVNSNKNDIVSSVTEFHKEAAIDEYTMQLVEEGIL